MLPGIKPKSGFTLFVQQNAEQSRYLCAKPGKKQHAGKLTIVDMGLVEGNPENPHERLGEILERISAKKIRPRNLVMLLARSEFEVNLFQIPELEADEIPGTIQNLVTEATDNPSTTTDFLLNSADGEHFNALTWTLDDGFLESLKNETRQKGLKLVSVTSHAMGSIALWRYQVQSRSPNAVVVTIANGAIDFSVIYHREITHVRSIPFQNPDVEAVTRRLISELQRTVAIVGDQDENDSTRIYLFGQQEKNKTIAEALSEEFDVPVSILNPLDQCQLDPQLTDLSEPECWTQLIGAAKGWFFDHLDIDLLSPRRPVQRTLPWKRIATWAAVALILIGSGLYVVWDDAQMQAKEIAEARSEFDNLAGDARRVLEMRDELAAIRAWRKDSVVWLDVLDDLSRNLPPREKTLIRRVSMSAGSSGQARIDLSVEVADSGLVTGLESALRQSGNQVRSKRVSESPSREGERWRFETSVLFENTPPKLAFVEPVEKTASDSNDAPVPGKNDAPVPGKNAKGTGVNPRSDASSVPDQSTGDPSKTDANGKAGPRDIQNKPASTADAKEAR